MTVIDLSERPGARHASAAEATEELVVDLLADVNVVLRAAHALVLDNGSGSLAVGRDGDGLATHWVAVRLGAHHEVGESDNASSVVGAGVILTAGTHTDGVVGDLT